MVLEAMQSLRSVRQFKDEPLPDETLREILNAGRRAQSSKNSQPWQFVVIRDKETLKRLSECGQFAGHLAGAAVGIALVSEGRNDFDLGQASANMQLAAWSLGIGSCIASMWEPDRAKEILGIPADHRFTVVLSLGYPADDWQPARMGGRRKLDELVRWEKW